ncbi:MAG: hypothetical protein JST57_13170 [Bacteroidetes bacterium]|nr:hypothetical protein [Bacteroidota bacterium]HAO05734.1 hypothetical protein [Chryseobacterium sp.]
MRFRILFRVIFILIYTFGTYPLFAQRLFKIDWQKDVDSLNVLIKREHYVFSKNDLPRKYHKYLFDLKLNASDYTDERMLLELNKLMVQLGDGHSYVLPFGPKNIESYFLPVSFYWFSEGLFVIDAEKPYESLIGSKVVSINNLDIKRVLKLSIQYVHHDNKMTQKWLAPSFLRFKALYEIMGLSSNKDSIDIKFLNSTGEKFNMKIPFVQVHDLKGVPKLMHPRNLTNSDTLLYLKKVDKNYWFKAIDKKTVYCQFNQVRNDKNESLDDFAKRLREFVNQSEKTKLIIDVRHNNGGNKEILDSFVNSLVEFSRVQGNTLYVITGRNTFSAAQIFISLLYRDANCKFLGEESSSKPNFVGEENIFILPNSGAIVSVSNKYHETIPGNHQKFIPVSKKISLSSSDYFHNIDPVLGFILNNTTK